MWAVRRLNEGSDSFRLARDLIFGPESASAPRVSGRRWRSGVRAADQALAVLADGGVRAANEFLLSLPPAGGAGEVVTVAQAAARLLLRAERRHGALKCLGRSFTICAGLRAMGFDAQVVIGVPAMPIGRAGAAGGFHAWAVWNSHVLGSDSAELTVANREVVRLPLVVPRGDARYPGAAAAGTAVAERVFS